MSGNAAGGLADQRAAGAAEIRAASFRGRDAVCGGDGFVAGGQPGAELADGAAGIRRRGQFVDNGALVSRPVSL